MPYHSCCVEECKDLTSSRHVFPKSDYDDDVYQEWIKRIGNAKMKYLPKEIVYKRFYICSRHFTEDCKVPGSNKLKKRVLPSLFLPGWKQETVIPLMDSNRIQKETSDYDGASAKTNDHDYALLDSCAVNTKGVEIGNKQAGFKNPAENVECIEVVTNEREHDPLGDQDEDDSYCQPELLCSIPTCQSSSEILFTFPTDDIICAHWSQHCKINETDLIDLNEVRKKYRICSAHFERNQFTDEQETKLIPNAIPTIFEDAMHVDIDCISVSSTQSWQDKASATMEVDLEYAESEKNCTNEIKITNETAPDSHVKEFRFQVSNKQTFSNEKVPPKVEAEKILTVKNEDNLQPKNSVQVLPKHIISSFKLDNKQISGQSVASRHPVISSSVDLPVFNFSTQYTGRKEINKATRTDTSISHQEVKFPKVIEDSLQKVEMGQKDVKHLSRLLKHYQSMISIGTCCLCLSSHVDVEEMDDVLVNKYKILFNELISVPNHFSKQICGGCKMKLNLCHTFHQGFSAAQEQLMRIASVLQNHSIYFKKITNESLRTEGSDMNVSEEQIYHELITDVVFSCKQCGEKFISKHKLDLHMNSKHGLQWPVICEKCGKKFKTKASLLSHQALSCKQCYNCPVCQRSFRTLYLYICHRRAMHKPLNLTICDICGKHIYVLTYKCHRAIHNKHLLCDLCGITFKSLYLLRTHHRRKHLRKICATCKICYKGHFSDSKVAQHFSVLHGRLNYLCMQCGRKT